MDSSSQNTAASETPAAATGAVAHPESPALDVSDTVLVVDDEPMIVELLTTYLERMGHRALGLSDPRKVAPLLESLRPSVCVLDYDMPDINGGQLMDIVTRSDSKEQVIFLTGEDDTDIAVDLMKRGALDYLKKPVRLLDVGQAVIEGLRQRRKLIDQETHVSALEHVIEEKTRALDHAIATAEEVPTSTLEALAAALDFRDQSTSGHSKRVACLTAGIAESMGIQGSALEQIRHGALLHDIGKLKIPDRILLKPGALTSDEWEIMRLHAQYGFDFCNKMRSLAQAREIVYAHHEKFDGSGYPRALKGDEIPLGARIFAIVDAVDAMIFDRPYRKGISFAEAEAEVRRCTGSHFDPGVVDVALNFLRTHLG